MKYNNSNLQKLESIFKLNEYVIRYEKGHFQSGYCVLRDKKVVVINRFFDIEARMNSLIEILQDLEIDKALFDDVRLKSFYFSLLQKEES
ncbi:MAG: hypothetical protein M9887_01255 [Chitinophagales bacterium]|nr:hypothetical protein [Chitinophagales bacterium]